MSLSQSFSQKIGNVRPLNPCPSLDIDFANGGYVNTGGFANQESVGSANFKIGAFNGPDPIFTRSSAATFRGSNGLIQYAPENLLQYSEQFNNASFWTPTNITVAADQITSPSGFLTADKLTTSGAAATQRIVYNTTQTGVCTYSIYVKAGTASFIQVVNGSSANVYANFNVSTGVVGNVGSSATSSITSVGNGWYRCVVSATIASSSSWQLYIVQSNTAAYGAAFSATVANLYVWGAQLERSSTARPYISTTSAARYGPRFEYDLNGNPLGLLMEEQSQNLLQYSEQFDNVYWTKTNLNTTGTPAWINVATAPDGAMTADKLTEDTINGVHGISRTQSFTAGTYVASVYLKRDEAARNAQIFYTDNVANSASWSVNLSTGALISGTSSTISIVNAGNDWWRVSFSITLAIGNTLVLAFRSLLGSSNSYTGNGTSGIYIWGAQLEQKRFATSYMPTVGGPMTRNADVVSSTIGSWFNQSEGTIVVSGDRNNNPTLNSTGSDSFFEFTSVGNYLVVHACDGTSEAIYDTNGSSAVVSGATIGSFTTVASSYSDITDLLHISRNGLATQSGASTGLGVTPTTLNIGYAPSNSIGYWNGHIKSFRYFPKALPNNLQRLSS